MLKMISFITKNIFCIQLLVLLRSAGCCLSCSKHLLPTGNLQGPSGGQTMQHQHSKHGLRVFLSRLAVWQKLVGPKMTRKNEE